MESNVAFAKRAVDDVSDPAKFKDSYDKGIKMAMEMEKRQFKKMQAFTDLALNMKSYHFDLSNTMKDIELLATMTNDNLKKVINKIDFRQKLIDYILYWN